jgi:FKBP-type peptidyl-prolyl cis-trans isomerase 2
MKVANGVEVRLEYELRVSGGDIIETSAHRGPLTYRHGDGRMLPGLERRLDGMSAGEVRTGVVPALEAFGDESSLPTKDLPRSSFPSEAVLKVDCLFVAKGPDGAPVNLKILTISNQVVQVRLVHPLAGKDLEFRVKILDVRSPGTAPPPPADAIPELDPDEIRDG